MTVTDLKGKPVYGATIRVHFSYGFLGLHKTDLKIGTNMDGKARFVGLPDDLDEALYFRASKGKSRGAAFDNPAKHCHAKHYIVLHKRGSSKPPIESSGEGHPEKCSSRLERRTTCWRFVTSGQVAKRWPPRCSARPPRDPKWPPQF